METEKEEVKEVAFKKLSKLVGGGDKVDGAEGTFILFGKSALAKLTTETVGEDTTYSDQEIIFLSEVESIKIENPAGAILVNLNMKSGAVESFELKEDADIGEVMNKLMTRINHSKKQ